jgi:hypothetical protein
MAVVSCVPSWSPIVSSLQNRIDEGIARKGLQSLESVQKEMAPFPAGVLPSLRCREGSRPRGNLNLDDGYTPSGTAAMSSTS